MEIGQQISGMARVHLNDYKRYMRSIEEAIAKRNAEIQSAFEHEAGRFERYEPEYQIIRESWQPDLLDYSSNFSRFLHEGFFLSCWSWFETYIQNSCSYIDKHLVVPVGWDTDRQSILNKSRTYFKKVGLVNIIRHSSWYEINNYSQIRNFILHHRSYITSKSDRNKAFIDYLARKRILREKLPPGRLAIIRHFKGNIEAEKQRASEMKKTPIQIILTEQFCSEVIEIYKSFFKIVGDEAGKLMK